MRLSIAAMIAGAVVAGAAQAADKPVIAPAPAWVKPVAPSAAPAKADEAPVRLLLTDQQVLFEPGRATVYSEVAVKIQTSQGLAAGNISLPWRPETDVLTVHKLRIRRGDQVIDVLASGQTFTVLRREQNLESATLDGVLTANIQPEGLQVGDVVEFAESVSSSDPVLKGHVEQLAAAWNGLPAARAHLRMQWPSSLPMRLRQTASLPALKPVKSGNTTSVELSLDNVEPVIPPKAAPPRFRIGRLVELTDYASWAELGALMAPLYVKAAAVPATGPLRAELDKIEKASADPKTRAEAALALVQDRVRYVALAMGAGGYVPADAEQTWSRRYGDCKGKTALLLALLHAMDIVAEPVAVNALGGDGLDERLPMIGLFNHVLVRATIAGKTYWLDGTRVGDTSLDRLRVPNFGWGLPLISQGAALVRIVPPPLDTPTRTTTIEIDARGGLAVPAPAKIETVFTGDEAVGANLGLANLTGEARDRALRDYWKGEYDFLDVATTTTAFDARTGEMRMAVTGKAKMEWKDGWYETDGTAVGYKADFARDPGPDRDAPFAVPYPYYLRSTETILLPPGFTKASAGDKAEVDQTVAGIAYHRHATLENNVFRIEKTERSVAPEFPAKDAPAAQATLRDLADRRVYLRKPAGYRATEAEMKAAATETPATAKAYIERGLMFLDAQRLDEAIKDFGQAIALEPKNVWALADRGLTYAYKFDVAAAERDLAAAEAIDPKNAVMLRGRAVVAEKGGNPKAVVAAYTKAVEADPNSSFALGRRAIFEFRAGDSDAAMNDAAAALKLNPKWVELYALRATILISRGDRDAALKEGQTAIAANPTGTFGHVAAARIYAQLDRPGDARKEYDAALAISPDPAIFAEKSVIAASADKASRQADVDAALKLAPKSREALMAKVALQQSTGDLKGAIATLTELIAASVPPANAAALAQRAELHKRAGEVDAALADSAAALKQEPRLIPVYLLRANLFRSKGREADALKEAAAVAAANPNDAYAHVVAARIYGTFHKDAEAFREFDRAIAIQPAAYVYLNRGYSRPRSDKAGRLADFEAALKLEPGLAEAVAAKASLQTDAGDYAGAIATYAAGLEKAPGDRALLTGRAIAYARAGDAAHADTDFAAVKAKLVTPEDYNNLCYSKAMAGVALDSALVDCNTALAKEPASAAYLDSRALVLLRLGKLEEAIADYDKALGRNRQMPTSLYGRSIAWGRKGNKAKSKADADAALALNPDVRTEFAGYGVTP